MISEIIFSTQGSKALLYFDAREKLKVIEIIVSAQGNKKLLVSTQEKRGMIKIILRPKKPSIKKSLCIKKAPPKERFFIQSILIIELL